MTNYFMFNGSFYKQIDGSPMGSPASPVLASIVMNSVIEYVLKKLTFKPTFMMFFVDDTIMAIPENSVLMVKNVFNSYHDKLQFTVECEVNGEIPFLDLMLIRKGTKIFTNYYQKPGSSGVMLNYRSHHPTTQKFSIVKGFISKVTRLSSPMFGESNKTIIFDRLVKNGYPKKLINKIYNLYVSGQFHNRHLLTSLNNGSNNNKTMYFKFPFIQKISYKVKKLLNAISNDVKLVFYTPNSIQNTLFSKIKDKDSILYKSDIVYKIDCMNCQKCYIGQTSQWLRNRLRQHKGDCTDKNKYKLNKTGLSQHRFFENHVFNFDNVKILASERQYNKRLVKEMIFIKINANNVNLRIDSDGLSVAYDSLLSQDVR